MARSGTDIGDPANIDSATADALAVSFEQVAYTAADGSNVTVKLALNTNPDSALTVPITTTV